MPFDTWEHGFLPDELALQLDLYGNQIAAFVPSTYVDTSRKLVGVLILGVLEDGSYLVELPGETTASGSRLRVPESILV